MRVGVSVGDALSPTDHLVSPAASRSTDSGGDFFRRKVRRGRCHFLRIILMLLEVSLRKRVAQARTNQKQQENWQGDCKWRFESGHGLFLNLPYIQKLKYTELQFCL